MSLILRGDKGSKLSIEEMDNYFTLLDKGEPLQRVLVPTEPIIVSDDSTSLYAILLSGNLSVGEINMPSLTTVGFIYIISCARLTSLDFSSLVTITSSRTSGLPR